MEYLISGIIGLILGLFIGIKIKSLPSKQENNSDVFQVDKVTYDKYQAWIEAEDEENKKLAAEARELSKHY